MKISKKCKLLGAGTLLGSFLFLTINGFAFVDHLTHYEAHRPETKYEREKEQEKKAEKESKDNGYSKYRDESGKDHHFVKGKEVH